MARCLLLKTLKGRSRLLRPESMASKRQREANRRNAAKSSGPDSSAGRRRASRNSHRHGLAASLPSTAEQARRVEKLARKIAGRTADPLILEHARAAAHAEFDLVQVRRVKVATINQVLALGRVGGLESNREPTGFGRASSWGEVDSTPSDDVAAPLPSAEPDRTAEAIRRALPELIKLDRYEHNAVIRREQAMRAIYAMHDFSV